MMLDIVNYLSNIEKNNQFLFIIIVIIVILLILIFIFNYLSNRTVRRQQRNRKRLIREINSAAKKIEVSKSKPIKEVVKEPVIEPVVEKAPITKTISVAVEDIEKIEDEEIIEVLKDDNESDVDRILREIKKASKEETMNLTEFEKEQEESAIISYDELCKRAGVKKKVYKATKEENDVVQAIKEVTEPVDNKKYKPTTFVSPIFGVQKETVKVEEDNLDQTFLQNLKDFRSTLDL